jgi:hypothetical protein
MDHEVKDRVQVADIPEEKKQEKRGIWKEISEGFDRGVRGVVDFVKEKTGGAVAKLKEKGVDLDLGLTKWRYGQEKGKMDEAKRGMRSLERVHRRGLVKDKEYSGVLEILQKRLEQAKGVRKEIRKQLRRKERRLKELREKLAELKQKKAEDEQD